MKKDYFSIKKCPNRDAHGAYCCNWDCLGLGLYRFRGFLLK